MSNVQLSAAGLSRTLKKIDRQKLLAEADSKQVTKALVNLLQDYSLSSLIPSLTHKLGSANSNFSDEIMVRLSPGAKLTHQDEKELKQVFNADKITIQTDKTLQGGYQAFFSGQLLDRSIERRADKMKNQLLTK